MSTLRLPRTTLFVPGNRPDRFIKAARAGAGAVIIDLEDAVAPADKPAAREAVEAAAMQMRKACDDNGCDLMVRINSGGTPWHEGDAQACGQLPIDAVLLPKPQSAAQVAQVWEWTQHKPLHLLMETLHSFSMIAELSRAPGVQRLVLGCADLMSEMSIHDDDAPLHYFRSQIVMHSLLAGLPAPIDGVCLELRNADALRDEIDRALRFGFGAKACIHPAQVPIADEGFRPSAAQVDWAREVLEISSDGRAATLNGKLIDGPICVQAQRILAMA